MATTTPVLTSSPLNVQCTIPQKGGARNAATPPERTGRVSAH
jgi:hypothetical protein